jgi:ribosomal protein L32
MGLTYPSNKICPRCGTGGYVWYLDNSEYVAKCTNCGHYFRREDFPMCVLDWLGQEVNDGKEEKEENQPAK